MILILPAFFDSLRVSTLYQTQIVPESSRIEKSVETDPLPWSWGINAGESLIFEFLEPPFESEYSYFKYVISEICVPNQCEETSENNFYSATANFYIWNYNGTVGKWIEGKELRTKSTDPSLIGNVKENGEINLNLPEFPLIFPCNTTITQMLGENLGALYDMQEFFSEEMMSINLTDYSFYTEIIDSSFDYRLNFTINPVLGVIDHLDIRLPDNDSGMLDFVIQSLKSENIPGNNLPFANASVMQSKNRVEFSSVSESIDPIVDYLWQFGDGFNSSIATEIHLFNAIGLYNANLTVWDCNGDFSIQNFQIEVFSLRGTLSISGYNFGFFMITGALAILFCLNTVLKKKTH